MSLSSVTLSSPKLPTRVPRILLAAFAVSLSAGLIACTPTIPVDAAKHATAVECAEVVVRLPDEIGNLKRIHTNAQGTAAWGSPSSVLLRCGLDMPVASDELCVNVPPVDWLADGTHEPDYIFVSYGREPAVEVIVDSTMVSGRTVLESLSGAIGVLPQHHKCLNLSDVEDPTGELGTPLN